MKNVLEPLYVGIDVAKETLEVALGIGGWGYSDLDERCRRL